MLIKLANVIQTVVNVMLTRVHFMLAVGTGMQIAHLMPTAANVILN